LLVAAEQQQYGNNVNIDKLTFNYQKYDERLLHELSYKSQSDNAWRSKNKLFNNSCKSKQNFNCSYSST